MDENLYKNLVTQVQELKDLASGGYVAVHDRGGQILYRAEIDDLYDEVDPFSSHAPVEGSVDPSAPIDRPDLYAEGATDANAEPDEGSVDPTADEPRKRRRKDPE